MRESEIEKKTGEWAVANGWTHYKFTSPGMVGVPDRFFARDGYVVFIEFKDTGKTPEPIQWVRIDDLRSAGLEVEFADSVDTARAILSGDVCSALVGDRTHPETRTIDA